MPKSSGMRQQIQKDENTAFLYPWYKKNKQGDISLLLI